jgi:hypothetical protein
MLLYEAKEMDLGFVEVSLLETLFGKSLLPPATNTATCHQNSLIICPAKLAVLASCTTWRITLFPY